MLFCARCRKLFHETEKSVLLRRGFDASSDPRMGTKVGSYLLLDVLGRGGMGKVYKAEHVFIGRAFAVKVLHPKFKDYREYVERFLFEARAAAASSTEHRANYGFRLHGRRNSLFVMEYMEGEELVDLIDRDAPLPLYRAVNILSQVASALAACHEAHIVHQDLKPENIFLVRKQGRRQLVHLQDDPHAPFRLEYEDSYDQVKILDFGVAHLARIQTENTIAGTPEYMAPEQARGVIGDFRSDIYSCGVIFYEMITGELPFAAETADELFQKTLLEPVVPPGVRFPKLKLPAAVDAFIERCLAKDPAQRYQNMDDFVLALRSCFGNVFYSRDLPSLLDKKPDIPASLRADLKALFDRANWSI
jgi:serine/threonine-protein kinase